MRDILKRSPFDLFFDLREGAVTPTGIVAPNTNDDLSFANGSAIKINLYLVFWTCGFLS